MKPRLVPALLVTLLLCWSGLTGHAQKATPLVDFTYIPLTPQGKNDRSRWPFEYAFGDWGKDRARIVRDKGLLINHLGSKGGLGANRPLPLKGAEKAVIVFIIGNTNEAEAFTFSLTDADGTNQRFRVPLATLAKGQVLTAVLRLDKGEPGEKPGTEPGLELKKLKSWQLSGDFGDKPIEVLVQKILAYHED